MGVLYWELACNIIIFPPRNINLCLTLKELHVFLTISRKSIVLLFGYKCAWLFIFPFSTFIIQKDFAFD
ncbi:hypothetical protein RO3G_04379 [Rhizopus delemar RA 99-880]|uniref:Uncharacterized protein n=1 Tax=Rhizopus delemar (strain RA 99-880 / ATCC MYA-4621 / FGSC 9543 / NRRL 43880) TaxID=246409 RepID=I1BTZ4_RHIO9|nr:hypothetical protein RO3G_04379 [Rhizopus delemar RA 99-880]|eukprot:EIE79674.1 hypothetical protein RO3G_04379 [Rhizopus delemar RA 99-880]